MMKRTAIGLSLAGSVLLSLVLLAAVHVRAERHDGDNDEPGSRYRITDLGTLGGPGTNSSAYDINSAGWVAGSGNRTPGGPQHAFLWFGKGPLIDLGTLGGPNSEAGGPNSRGEAAIISETSLADPNGEDFCGFGTHLQCLAAIWRNWKLTALPTLPGGHNAQAYGLNNGGQVIGFSENSVEDSSCSTLMPSQVFRYEAVVWEPNGKIRKLRPLHGDTVGFGFGINDHGEAVGTSGLCGESSVPPLPPNGRHAVLWDKAGAPHDLGNLGGTSNNIASSVNDRGDVVGTSQSSTDGNIHAFLWTRQTGMRDLGLLPGAFLTVAPCCDTVNDSRQVVGFSCGPLGCSAFLWQGGVMTDLNDIASGDPMHLSAADAINSRGQIVGVGETPTGEVHGFLATPRNRRDD